MSNKIKEMIEVFLYGYDIYPDHIVMKKTGEVEIRRSYFYRGDLPGSYVKAFEKAGISVTVSDHYRDWPKVSYFAFSFKPTPELMDRVREAYMAYRQKYG